MLDRLARSRCKRWILSLLLSEERISDRADCALGMLRTHRKSVAPVRDSARAVDTPIPEEQPVMRMTLPWREVGVRLWV